MPEWGETVASDRTIPVQQVRPGDHVFAVHRDEAEQREMLGVFIRQGLLAGEKVLVCLGPEHLDTGREPGRETERELLAGLGLGTTGARRALDEGRLRFSSMRALILPEKEFSAERQWHRLTEETERAVDEGFAALRAYIDMAWIADLGTDVSAVCERERNAGHLFADRPYSEVCAYDDRTFGTGMLDAMADAHPRHLLHRPGDLHAAHAENSVRLIGDADIGTGDAFGHALRTAYLRTARRAEPHLTVDLTALHFLGAGCAAGLLRQCAAAQADDVRTTVRCTPFQAEILQKLGSGSLPALGLSVTGGR